MKNKILIIAASLLISSCSLFKDSTKSKEKTTIDSVGTTKIKTKAIDTSSFKNYEKISLYFKSGAAPADYDDIFNFADGLRNAATGLAFASQNLKDSTQGKPTNKAKPKAKRSLLSLPGLMAATWEKGSAGKKGLTEEKKGSQKTDLNKSGIKVDIEEKANPKMGVIIGVLAILVTAIICFSVFSYFKSKK